MKKHKTHVAGTSREIVECVIEMSKSSRGSTWEKSAKEKSCEIQIPQWEESKDLEDTKKIHY